MRSYGVGLSPVSLLKRSWIVWIAICVMAVMASALYWHISEPGRGALLIDFQKAYYAAGKAVLNNDPAALGALIADATFVNIPIVAWLFFTSGPPGATWRQINVQYSWFAGSGVCIMVDSAALPS